MKKEHLKAVQEQSNQLKMRLTQLIEGEENQNVKLILFTAGYAAQLIESLLTLRFPNEYAVQEAEKLLKWTKGQLPEWVKEK